MDYSYALMDLTVYGSPGKMGRFASGMATTMHIYAYQKRRTHLGTRVAGRTANRPVAAARSWTLRRPGEPIIRTGAM